VISRPPARQSCANFSKAPFIRPRSVRARKSERVPFFGWIISLSRSTEGLWVLIVLSTGHHRGHGSDKVSDEFQMSPMSLIGHYRSVLINKQRSEPGK
jgi:hypothetical protein